MNAQARPEFGRKMFAHVSRGWRHTMPSPKSFLESGKGMVAPWYQEAETA